MIITALPSQLHNNFCIFLLLPHAIYFISLAVNYPFPNPQPASFPISFGHILTTLYCLLFLP